MLLDKFETKLFNQSWNNVASSTTTGDQLLIDLNANFGKHSKVIGLMVFIQNAAIPAYNDSTACKFYSGAHYIAF